AGYFSKPGVGIALHGFIRNANGTIITFDPAGSAGTQVLALNNSGTAGSSTMLALKPTVSSVTRRGTSLPSTRQAANTERSIWTVTLLSVRSPPRRGKGPGFSIPVVDACLFVPPQHLADLLGNLHRTRRLPL